MNLSFFIARRMMQRDAGQKPGVMERIAVVSVALSLSLMLLSVAVILGFKREVSYNMSLMAAHVTLTDVRSVNALDSEPVVRTPHLDSLIRSVEGFEHCAPYAVRGGIIRTRDAVEGVVLKGVDTAFRSESFRPWITSGSFPRVGDSIRTKDILISRTLADRLMLDAGDKVEMLFVEHDALPRRDRFKISGIYSSGMDEMDKAMILTDIRNVRRLSDWTPEMISGYEIFTRDMTHADDFARRLNRALLFDESPAADEAANLVAMSVMEQYPNIFDWLKAHDVNAAVIIVIMLVVAFFNITTALLILVLERTRMIGLLKSLGMTNSGLRRIFLYRASFIALRGMAWGNAVGVGLCLVQQWTGLLRLDAEGYLLSVVPVSLGAGWILLLNVGVLLAIVLLLTIPTYIISTVKPGETIRYE